MIDIHTHVLPCVDDGSQSEEKSLEMLKELYKNGVRQVFLTPHYRFHYKKSPQAVKTAFEKFRDMAERQVPIKLFLGQEVYVEDDVKELYKSGEVLTMNGTKYLLCEFSYTYPCDVSETVYELCCMGVIPIIAHVERYSYLTIDDIYEIKNEGGLIQVNADALLTKDKKIRKLIKKLFAENLVDFVASDVHEDRAVCMSEAYAFIKKKFGEDVAEDVFFRNAERLIKG